MAINKEIAAIFYAIADLLDLQGVEWKPIAFRKAARTLENYSEPMDKIVKAKGIKGVMELPGIGEGIGKKIVQYVEEGKIDEYEELKKEIPAGVRLMLNVPGMGPKKAARLYKELKIDSLEKLEAFAKEGKIRALSGFGEKSEQDILMGLELVKKGQERKLMGIILPYARELAKKINSIPGVQRVELAGSLRRRRETVKDIDILALAKDGKKVMDAFVKLPDVEKVVSKGDTKTAVILKMGLNCDLRVLSPEVYGAGLVHFTGSKEHNVALRMLAIKKGMKLDEYGLFDNKSGKNLACKNEEDVYARLGMQYIPPEMRENTGEIELAQQKKIPELIGYDAIHGDLHTHTNWSDGANTTEEMVVRAVELGYDYYAITDHSKSDVIANGLNEKRVKEHFKEIDALQKKFPQIQLLKGAEVAILSNGKLDYGAETLKEMDIVVGSIHSGFKTPPKEMTKRLLTAMENEYLTFLGHPTGRLLNQRNPYEYDIEKILETAASNRIAVEVNAFPSRMDFDADHIRLALQKKVKLVINTDSHSTQNLDFMEFGIAQARRGWAKKEDVLNALPWKAFQREVLR
ncbi:MAG: DNA polymerase/3'-5' exonuclease PolX [Candidatus Iainarchaeum archaeon]|uniref:DNA polymerase beta n=1 Tax=Candidatus Iainarchaeum sp. TaxID=3101447 RepID=A0A7T9DJ71_9ARCH|nr:MAG: DNA polymerase/3'-5' exonuclease PolX [Candidatus Diapherotrites archaeon]